MNGGQSLTLYFYCHDDRRVRVPVTNCTVADAENAIQRIFSISEGLYTKAEIYRSNELVETVTNTVGRSARSPAGCASRSRSRVEFCPQ
jgi:hypothetical protein